jgi:hypothetical protein
MNEMKDPMEYLERIAPVAPPPFLFTRTEARIRTQMEQQVPMGRLVAIFCGLALLLAVNGLAMLGDRRETQPQRSELPTLGTALGIHVSNQLYHE